VLLALSSGQKLGLALVAAAFIAFALLSAMVVPRFRPRFPGRGLRLYIPATLVLFVGMMTAVYVFGEEEHHESSPPVEQTTPEQPRPPSQPQPQPQPQPQAQAQPEGNAAAGKQVFASAGCSGCHTFQAAGSNGQVGPNLDEALQGKDAAFVRESIVDPNAEIAKGFPRNVMPQDYEQRLSKRQLSDLVAFLTQ
jgi:mono/diheme cytochrome c family protein